MLVGILGRGPSPPKSTNHQASGLSAQMHSDFAIVIVGPQERAIAQRTDVPLS
jgi:hypothetical protein